jgi:hypothetical protein
MQRFSVCAPVYKLHWPLRWPLGDVTIILGRSVYRMDIVRLDKSRCGASNSVQTVRRATEVRIRSSAETPNTAQRIFVLFLFFS